MHTFFRNLVRILDPLFAPFTALALLWMRAVRFTGLRRTPVSKRLYLALGVFPLRDHFYEPLFHPRHLRRPLGQDRVLPGLDMDVAGQLELLSRFHFQDELSRYPAGKKAPNGCSFTGGAFGAGDAEFFYSLIRSQKPRRILEIGSGNSTRVADLAIEANLREDPDYRCDLTCVDPYNPTSIERALVLPKKVEELDQQVFECLEEGDILFIDSSHMIRPQGDVLFEFLEILPTLRVGVWIHVHDIFTPADYPESWIREKFRFWNEQYLLEAFLTLNRDFRVSGALNFLCRHHFAEMADRFPNLRADPKTQPGSFWIQRIAPGKEQGA